jgi:tripartite-type tricarboxylate transporter receptor subunit TctC
VIYLLNEILKWLVDSEVNVKSLILDKKLKPIAIYSNKRLPDYPTVPTLRELGVNDLNFYRWYVLLANKNADPEVLKYISTKLKDQNFRNELSKLTVMDNPNLQNFLLDESVKVRRIVRDFTPR